MPVRVSPVVARRASYHTTRNKDHQICIRTDEHINMKKGCTKEETSQAKTSATGVEQEVSKDLANKHQKAVKQSTGEKKQKGRQQSLVPKLSYKPSTTTQEADTPFLSPAAYPSPRFCATFTELLKPKAGKKQSMFTIGSPVVNNNKTLEQKKTVKQGEEKKKKVKKLPLKFILTNPAIFKTLTPRVVLNKTERDPEPGLNSTAAAEVEAKKKAEKPQLTQEHNMKLYERLRKLTELGEEKKKSSLSPKLDSGRGSKLSSIKGRIKGVLTKLVKRNKLLEEQNRVYKEEIGRLRLAITQHHILI